MNTKKLPIGYDDYKEVVEGRFYYMREFHNSQPLISSGL